MSLQDCPNTFTLAGLVEVFLCSWHLYFFQQRILERIDHRPIQRFCQSAAHSLCLYLMDRAEPILWQAPWRPLCQ